MQFTYVISKVIPKTKIEQTEEIHNIVLNSKCEPINLEEGSRCLIAYINNNDNLPHMLFTSFVEKTNITSKTIDIETENTIYRLKKTKKSDFLDIDNKYNEYFIHCRSLV